jgi:hypothetical protein
MLFFTPFGEWQVHNQLDGLIALAARARGINVHYITCTGTFQPCAITRDKQDCARCQEKMKVTLTAFGLEGLSLDALTTMPDLIRVDSWLDSLDDSELCHATFEGLPIGEWALSTVMTHFRVSSPARLAHPRIINHHRRFLRDTLLTYILLERYISDHVIDALFLFNGRFYPYRAALEAAKKHRVRVLVHERGRTESSFSFFDDHTCLDFSPLRSVQQRWMDTPLQSEQIHDLSEYLKSKLQGHIANWPSFYKGVDAADPYSLLDIPRGARLIGFFTTSSDELAHFEGFEDVTRQFDLIESVAEALAGTEIYLIVRHHPAIGGSPSGTVELVGFDESYARALDRPRNVRVIMPADKLASPALFPYLIGAIVPFSSLSAEAIAYGVPTIVATQSEIGFSPEMVLTDWSLASVRAAVRKLADGQLTLTTPELTKFYRWCYAGVFRFSLEFEAIGITNFFEPQVRVDLDKTNLHHFDGNVARIFDYFNYGTLVYPSPTGGEELSDDAERKFVKTQLVQIEDKRRAIDNPVRSAHEASPGRLVVITDGSVGRFGPDQWQLLPHGSCREVFSLRLNDLWKDPGNNLWKRLKRLLLIRTVRRIVVNSAPDSFILLTDGRSQFHDLSPAVMDQAISHAIAEGKIAVALRGWVRIEGELAPVQWDAGEGLGSSTNSPPSAIAARSAQFFLLRRDWLLEQIIAWRGTADIRQLLRSALLSDNEAWKLSQPVFLAET